MKLTLAVLGLLMILGFAWAGEPQTMRLTSDGRSILGAFSPDGQRLVALRLDHRHEAQNGIHYFGYLDLWQGHDHRLLAQIEEGEPYLDFEIPENLTYDWSGPHWLPSGEYVYQEVVRDNGAHAWALVRVSEGAVTRAGLYKSWFVLNAAWQLSTADAGRLNAVIHNRSLPPAWVEAGTPPTDSDSNAMETHRGRESGLLTPRRHSPITRGNWLYESQVWAHSPAPPEVTTQLTYLGVASGGGGHLRRLTPNYHGPLEKVKWSPDGARVAYLWQVYSPKDEAYEPPPLRSDLEVVGLHGQRPRLLVSGALNYYWLDSYRIVAEVGLRADAPTDPEPRQLVLIDVPSGKQSRLTSGNLQYWVCDVHGDNLLVVQRPLGGDGYEGNLDLVTLP